MVLLNCVILQVVCFSSIYVGDSVNDQNYRFVRSCYTVYTSDLGLLTKATQLTMKHQTVMISNYFVLQGVAAIEDSK